MNFLSWNCRGLGNSRAVRHLGDLIKSSNPDFLFLSETKVGSNKIDTLCRNFRFAHYFAVDSIGTAGGLAILWKNHISCTVVDSSMNYIDVIMLENNVQSWWCSCFYGIPERSRRRESWNIIRSLSTRSHLPWFIFGDFNDMLLSTDKKGVHPHPQYLLNGFRSAIEDCSLLELDLVGGKFTWEKSKGTPEWVRERLDRAFATANWWNKFPLCKLSVSHSIHSDQIPFLLNL